ncbi:putative PEP-binding protein [Kutzneria kofuensis]|uniref:Pyruvate, phosphate dikinase n=1 Tax=Kutzneria kofuensis TaxID=103725 RepID=A0A7W9KP07_9PSEU|nr:putative PEP-binding protein [Kutzneria kofuensis]MBB5896084.1 pyruvate,orthophosphate dikinase [Kutzneria kofuensis]
MTLNDLAYRPPGFTLAADTSDWPVALHDGVQRLEQALDRGFGAPDMPLLLCAQATVGDAVLNIGLSKESLPGLTALLGSADAAEHAYGRLETALGQPPSPDPHHQLRSVVEGMVAAGADVEITSMVFGNSGVGSGTGLALSRHPESGEPGLFGWFLPNATGVAVADAVAGTDVTDLSALTAEWVTELAAVTRSLERVRRDMCEIQFVVEHGRLWILDSRPAPRSAAGAFRVAKRLADDGIVTEDEMVGLVTGEQLTSLLFAQARPGQHSPAVATGQGVSPGIASGPAVFDAERARARPGSVLVLPETTPADMEGMLTTAGILTARGGSSSHAAVVARGVGVPCVCAAAGITIDLPGAKFRTAAGISVHEGEFITIDGATGTIHLGQTAAGESEVLRHLETPLPVEERSELVAAVDAVLGHADRLRRLEIRANADTAADAARARAFGATGIGLCRTEHLFLGARSSLVADLVRARTAPERNAVLAVMTRIHHGELVEVFAAMSGLPVTVRLLDPPLHEFVPDHAERETNPMLGRRGVRLGLTVAGLFAAQARAVAEAALTVRERGGDPRPEIMIPFVSTERELRPLRTEIETALAEVFAAHGESMEIPIGTMIELPRAALTADALARHADFFSFGTNDLTQTTWGMSRDDAESTFLRDYVDRGVVEDSPFGTYDQAGVGQLVATALRRGHAARADLVTGVCGEHAQLPEAVARFHDDGVDYLSCSPFAVPAARLEAARAALHHRTRSLP